MGASALGTVLQPGSDRSTRLMEVTAALLEARSPLDIAQVLVTRGVAAMDFAHGVVALVEGNELRIVAHQGYPDELIDKHRSIPLERRVPLCEAVRDGASVWLENRDQAFARCPDLPPLTRALGTQAWISIPLRASGRIFGVLGISFERPRTFPPEERAFAETLANVCAQAFERVRLLEAARIERDERDNVLQSLNDGIVTMDAQGRLIFCNRVAAELLGFATPQEVLACPPDELYSRFDVLDEAGVPVARESLPAYRALLGEEPPELVLQWRAKGTTRTRWSTCRFLPLRGSDARVVGVITIFREITPLREAQNAAQVVASRYQALVETAMDGIVSADAEGRITYVNPAAQDMFGYPAQELVGQPLRALVPERFHAEQEEGLRRALEGPVAGARRAMQVAGRMRNGMEFPIEVTIAPGAGGDRFTAIIRDVTDRVRAEEVVEEQRAHLSRFKKIFDSSLDGIAYIDAQGRYVEQNPAHRRLLGYEDAEIEGRTPAMHLGQETFDAIMASLQEAGRFRGEIQSRHKDGRSLDIELSASTVRDRHGRVLGHVGINRDIGERKRAEAALRRQVEKQQVMSHLTQMVGRAERVEDVYDAAIASLRRALQADRASILLYDADDVLRFKAWTLLSPEYRAAVEGHSPWPRDARDPPPVLVSDVFDSADWAAYRPLFEREGIRALGFLPLVHQGVLLGKCMVYYDAPHVFTDEEVQLAQAIAGHVSFAIERRQGRVALRDADENLRVVMDASPLLLTYIDPDRRYRYVNRRFSELHGRSRDEIVGRGVEEILGPQIYAQARPCLDMALKGHPASFDVLVDLPGGAKHLFWQYVPILGPEGGVRGVHGVIVDVTAQKEHEEELRGANERLKELDRLKTQFLNAVSHELRTPLTPIQLQLDVLGATHSKPEARSRAVEILDRNVRRLTRLVQEMVDVSKLQAGRFMVERTVVDLHRVVVEAFESYQEPARQARVDLQLRSNGPVPVLADGQRVAQVLSNLLSNALKFTPAGRAIRLELEAGPAEVTVRVRDEGVGLTPDQVARLFQPFTQVHASSEAQGSGTGLGLYLCRGMVEAHGGRIWAESPGPQQGAVFSFTLPREAA